MSSFSLRKMFSLDIFLTNQMDFNKTIIPLTLMASESIAHSAFGLMGYLTIIPRAQMGYWLRGHEGEGNNCFSKIQLVGQNNIET